ncbi:hypothetical protein [Asticcacaulis endophyticus]|uniref:Uncharacterized protein n=1 Tax=Asticcacaulis endophyticus TaxID=1395890 RepID=A0A918Q3D8_9CAUL|nr:hypothetical protein [Asticcacaulis endophyticus]GGZ32466.1 hypothetical protein GCM10011273_18280 [Asticcacaulis endophyticus]
MHTQFQDSDLIEDEIAVATRNLFAEITSVDTRLQTLQNYTDENVLYRLTLIAEAKLIPHRAGELEALTKAWHSKDFDMFKRLLVAYHERRTAYVPQLTKMINAMADRINAQATASGIPAKDLMTYRAQ